MSDFILGAIIGVGGTLIGSIVGGYISYKTTSEQIKSRDMEQQRQLKHEEAESRRIRLIEARRPYLLPLMEVVSKWAVELNHMIEQTEILGRATKNYKEHPFIFPKPDISLKKAIEGMGTEMKKLKEQLEVLRGQASDQNLNDAIDDVLKIELDVRFDSMPILSSAFGTWLSEEEKGIEPLDKAIRGNIATSLKMKEYLQQVNKRIEELLIGDRAV